MNTSSPLSARTPSQEAEQRRRDAAGRSNCYGLLALVFRDTPTPETIAALRGPPLATVLKDTGYDVAQDLAGKPEDVASRLSQEYTRLLVGPGPHVSPYGSVHHAKEGTIWGDSTVRAKRFIDATGLAFEGNWDSIPDHISIELELMQRLAAHEAELWLRRARATGDAKEDAAEQLRRCLVTEEEFLREHIRAWVPRFCEQVSAAARLPFYREMAGLAASLVTSDTEHVAAALSAF